MKKLVKILILDGVETLTQSISTKLSSKEYAVESCSGITECLQRLSAVIYDILIVDLDSLNGGKLNLLQKLYQQYPYLTPILILQSGDVQNLEKTKRWGFIDYVIKDVANYDDFLTISIENVIVKRQLKVTKEQLKNELSKCKKTAERAQSIAKVGNWEYFPGQPNATWSQQEFRNFGYQPGAIAPTYEKYLEVIHPDDRELVERFNISCLEKHVATDFVFRLLLEKDQIRYIHAITEVDINQNNEVTRVFGVSQDITEQKMAEARLKQAATVFETSTEAIFVTDEKNQIVSINAAFTHITGYSEQQAIGNNPSLLSSDYHDASFFHDFWSKLKQQGSWQGEIWNRRRDGKIFPCWQSVTVIKDEQGNTIQHVSIFLDITKRKESEDLIRYQANYDSLTDLPNRTLFCDRMKNSIMQAKRSGKRVALMLLDLDKFKWINDTFGHRAGDLILIETAKRLKQTVRNSDTVARLGGDEFTVILSELVQDKDAEIVATKIFSAFADALDIDGNEVYISASIGISIYPDDGKDSETLQKNADSAMYAAKQAGRNRFHYFTPLLQAEAERRFLLINLMRNAVERNEFSVYYQPVIDITNNTIASAEALIRWQQPSLGFVSPAEFIPLAEEAGLIREIGDWVLRRVAEDMQRWLYAGLKPIQISINKSPKQFVMAECYDDWKTILDEYNIPMSYITVEITETVLMDKYEQCVLVLKKMRALGMKVSLDDFGTGYSSLSYLKRFPVDILKIDREFINDLAIDPGDALLVETIITLAEKMNLKVIAEGVETQEQLDFLKKNNCPYVQGYYFSKPLPVNEFEGYLNNY